MPVFTIAHTPRFGARVQVQIGLSHSDILRLRLAHQPIPQSVIVTALIDTGAECSCVDPGVVARAQLPFRGAGFSAAPGVAAGPAILGGSIPSSTYEAGVTILHPSARPRDHLVVESLSVEELPLRSFGIEAVIGRDVLVHCVVVYDGPAGSLTLAY